MEHEFSLSRSLSFNDRALKVMTEDNCGKTARRIASKIKALNETVI